MNGNKTKKRLCLKLIQINKCKRGQWTSFPPRLFKNMTYILVSATIVPLNNGEQTESWKFIWKYEVYVAIDL